MEWASLEARSLISNIKPGHPRIFLTPEKIPGLLLEANGSKSKIFKLMVQRTKGIQAALFYAMGNEKILNLPKSREEYGRMAARELMHAISENNRRTSIDDLAVLYDWAYGALTHGERQIFVKFCKLKIGNKIKIHGGRYHGYRSSPYPVGLIAALAIYGDGLDDEYAKGLLIQGVRDTLLDNLAMQHMAGDDGGYADGLFYIYSLGGTFNTFLALGTATSTDFFLKHETLAKLPKHLLYAMLPFEIQRTDKNKSRRYFATFHDNWTLNTNEYGSSGKRLVERLYIVAAEYRRKGDEKKASLYKWFLEKAYGDMPYQGANPLSFVLMDWSIESMSPDSLGIPEDEVLGWDEKNGRIDRDRFGKKAGIGWVSMRSGWNDPDATFAIFKAEPFYYHGHMHRDSLAFMIAKGEELALARAGNYMNWFEGGQFDSRNSGWPQMMNFFSRTVSSNNLLIINPEEKFKYWEETWSNEGGQRLTSYWDKKWGRGYHGTGNGNSRDIGGLIRFERGSGFVYAAADATRAYNSVHITTGSNKPKVSLVQREFVYLKSPSGVQDSFVIFDRVRVVEKEFKPIWLLQLRAKPEFDGRHQVALGNETGGIHISNDSSKIYVPQERAELYCNSLLPKDGNRVVRRLGGNITTRLIRPLDKNANGPLDIAVESTAGLPDRPVVIITDDPVDPEKEVFDRFSVWPKARHATAKASGRRVCYFCDGKTPLGDKLPKLLGCIRAKKSAPAFEMPTGARVIQEFRHMGMEGADRDKDSERINYPWGYGLGYNYGDGNQYGLWRVEINPKDTSNDHHFFHVLQPAMKGKGDLTADLIESESGSLYGAKVKNKLVMFVSDSEMIEEGEYKVKHKGRLWQLLCNLSPEKEYMVMQDGKMIYQGISSRQGTLSFESANHNTSTYKFSIEKK